MLSKTVAPKTKTELIRALQAASFRSVEVFEDGVTPSLRLMASLKRSGATLVVLLP